jgi:RNA polymerase sigma factor (sigma-70 family)
MIERSRTDPLASFLEQALDKVAKERGVELAATIEAIVWANWNTGRAHKFVGVASLEGCEEYVNRIADNYLEYHNQVRQLTVDKDPAAWKPFFEQLQKWAYNYLRQRSFPGEVNERSQHAVDCAVEAAGRLLAVRYPYDAIFGCWAYILLQKTCLKHMARHINPTSVPASQEVELDETAVLHSGGGQADEMQMIDMRHDILLKIAELSPDRKEFIQCYYFEGKTFTEIGALMKRSTNSLYKLHHDALAALGKKSGRIGDNNE